MLRGPDPEAKLNFSDKLDLMSPARRIFAPASRATAAVASTPSGFTDAKKRVRAIEWDWWATDPIPSTAERAKITFVEQAKN